MKIKILSLLIAVLMALTALAACEKAPAGAENSGGSGESVSESGESERSEQSQNESGTQTSTDENSSEEKAERLVFSSETIEAENGIVSEEVCAQIFKYTISQGENFLSGDTANVSFSLPETWSCVAWLLNGGIFCFCLYNPEYEDSEYAAVISVYADDGTTFDKLFSSNALLSYIDENTYFEIEGENYEKGSFIDFLPSPKLIDKDDPSPVYGSHYYKLQFDGYVVSVDASIRMYEKRTDVWVKDKGDEQIAGEIVNSIIVNK